jgi:P-type Ca2+ transporter type 2C
VALIGPKILWHSLSKDEVAVALEVGLKNGLQMEDVLKRRSKYGKNAFRKSKRDGLFKRIFKQIKNPLVAILAIAGLITLFLGEYVDTTVIFIAVFINVLIGTLQEERASKAFQKLNSSQEHFAFVIRGGRKSLIPIEDLVQGDLVFVEAGNFIPADLRLVDTKNFEVNESSLTGEWVAVPKDEGAIDKDKPLSEQSSMAWMGTLVATGFAKGIVVEIGSKTQIGLIAESLSLNKETNTPIQKSIKKLAKFLAIIIAVIVLGIFTLGIFRGEPLGEMLLISVAMAVSVIPEGLPAAVTVVLVLGMERILNKGGLVKNLLAAETLGSTTIILTDKTGTLTKGRMKLTSAYTLSTLEEMGGREADEKELIKMATLSSDAFIEEGDNEAEIIVRGRPLEKAIVMSGLEAGFNYLDMQETDKRIDFLPFDSENGFLASLNFFSGTKEKKIYLSGSPEKLLAKSKFVLNEGRAIKLSSKAREEFERVQEKWSKQGMRFLALAYKDTKLKILPKKDIDKVEDYNDLVFVGLLAFEDTIREDVPSAIQTAKEAGARVLMVTGDNKYTAYKIAQDVGIAESGDRVLVGKDIEKMNDKDLLMMLGQVKVFARVLPSQKLRISRVLQGSGEIVAMTGDGVNDAPALKGAHIGIAVESATEIAKDSSDLILIDNSFSVIVRAIEEGRRIMDNIKKIVSYLLATSFGEIFVIAGALAFALPLPILPAQILWINILEEGVMNFAFAFEPKEKGLMKRNPGGLYSQRILTPDIKKLIFTIGLITGLLAILIYFFLLKIGLPIEEIRTIIFAVLALDPIFFALSLKSLKDPIWRINIFSNKYLILSVLLSTTLLVGALSLEPLRELLRLTPLHFGEIMLLLGVGIFNLFLIEISKFFIFRKDRRRVS